MAMQRPTNVASSLGQSVVAERLADERQDAAPGQAETGESSDPVFALIARAERACGPLFDCFGPIAGE